MNQDLVRADAFARRVLSQLSTDIVPFEGGVAYLDRDFPLRYDSNLLWIDEPGTATAERWVDEAERILGSRHYRHRKVVVSDLDAMRRLTPGFVAHGYTADGGVLMVRRGEPDRPPDGIPVEEVSFDEVRPLLEEIQRLALGATDDETVRMLTDHAGKLAETIGARFFATRIEGRLVGCCQLYVEGDEAQVESVGTLEEFRGRGLARAFVLAASDAARQEGAEWVHLWADADDWPQHWYRKLGFHVAAQVADFRLGPEAEAAAMSAAKSPEA
jgi:N-acetylglutamate synthase-like GNAT family acetyltransferase